MSSGWIGVDLDGTLAEYDEWRGPEHIGAPIPAMVERVKRWLAEGRKVRIFTARVSLRDTDGPGSLRFNDAINAAIAIRAWSVKVFGEILPVTCIKDFDMIELWDDRCVQVEANTGALIGRSPRGLE